MINERRNGISTLNARLAARIEWKYDWYGRRKLFATVWKDKAKGFEQVDYTWKGRGVSGFCCRKHTHLKSVLTPLYGYTAVLHPSQYHDLVQHGQLPCNNDADKP